MPRHRMLPHLTLLFLLSLFWIGLATPTVGQEDAPRITPEKAGDFEGKKVVVEFEVKSSRLLDSGAFAFLNSREDFREEGNFTAAIPREGLAEFTKRKISDPAEHFLGSRVRVTGVVSKYKGRPQIKVLDPDQIKLVLKVD